MLREPASTELPADGHHIPDTEGEIGPLLNDAAPGGPDRRSITGTLQNITEGFHVFRMETDVQFAVHILRDGGALGIDIKHDEGIITIKMRNAFGALQRVIQSARSRRGRIDADHDERTHAAGTQNIPIFRIMIRDIEPGGPVE